METDPKCAECGVLRCRSLNSELEPFLRKVPMKFALILKFGEAVNDSARPSTLRRLSFSPTGRREKISQS